MKLKVIFILIIVFIFPHQSCSAQNPSLIEVDIAVYGGTSAGVIAAYTAKRYGKSVILIEPGSHLGGMSSGGLGQTDIGNKEAITGLSRNFYERVGAHYGEAVAWKFEPHIAEKVFNDLIKEENITVLYHRRLHEIEKEGTEIKSLILESSKSLSSEPTAIIKAKIFIDASYEGDLMAKSGASYTVGREANSEYNETLNGVQLRKKHQFPDGVDPYVIPVDPDSGLLPEIDPGTVAPDGTSDKKVQAYNFRLCLTQDETNRMPIPMPDNYDPVRYELLLRLMAIQPWESLNDGFIINIMPNGKSDWNNRGGFSLDYIGKNWEYPEADYQNRAEIWKAHQDYEQGLLYFIANDPRVPEPIRNEMRQWGLCKDEFQDTNGWPHQLYIREARRMIGEYVMTEHNSTGEEVVEDGVGLAAYGMDSHNCQRLVVNGMVRNEGNVEVDVPGPYPVSYRSLTPKRVEVTNLLVPVALSASHIAYGSIRMEPVYMVLAQSAAVAASIAFDLDLAVQEIDVPSLQRELKENPLAENRALVR